jgi:hypothetical protein
MLVLLSACSNGAIETAGSGGSARRAVATTTVLPATTVSPTTTGPTTSDNSDTPDNSAATTTTTLLALDPPTFESLEGINTILDFSDYVSRGRWRWDRSVPGIDDIRITSVPSNPPCGWHPAETGISHCW